MRSSLIVLALVVLAITGCHSTSPTVHPDSVSERDAAMLGEISRLIGDWEMADETGTKHHTATFALTSAGSAVREIMFPGQDHEMTNLYHMDGDQLVITHYCAAGNQPRMVASRPQETAEGIVFHFEFDSVSNLRESHEHFMGDMTLTIFDADGIRQDWRSLNHEGELTGPATFMLTRMK